MTPREQFFHLLFLILVTAVCAAYKCEKLEKEINKLKAQIANVEPFEQ